MRKLTQGNPIVQVVVIGGLALVMALMLYVRVLHKASTTTPASSSSAAPTGSTSSTPATAPDQGSTGSSDSTAGTGSASGAVAPPSASDAATAPSAGADQAQPGVAGAEASAMTPGEGLPAAVSRAYRKDDVIVLSIYQQGGVPATIDLRALRAIQRAHGVSDHVAIFRVPVSRISRYARVAQGVDINRSPAIIVISPRSLSDGGTPSASVRYGYMGPRSAAQAVFDAVYSGPQLPYYPN
jgi:hypothetical protein